MTAVPVTHLADALARCDLTSEAGRHAADDAFFRAISEAGGLCGVLLTCPEVVPWWSLPRCNERLRRSLEALDFAVFDRLPNDSSTSYNLSTLVERLYDNIHLIITARATTHPATDWSDDWLTTLFHLVACSPSNWSSLELYQAMQNQSPTLLPIGANVIEAMLGCGLCMTCRAEELTPYLALGGLPGHSTIKPLTTFINYQSCTADRREVKEAMDQRLLDSMAGNLEQRPREFTRDDLQNIHRAVSDGGIPRRYLDHATRLKRATVQELLRRSTPS